MRTQRSNPLPEAHRPPRPHPGSLAALAIPLPPPPHAAGPTPTPHPAPALSAPSRWSISAWALARPGDGRAPPGIAPGGTLGGSQAGLRLLYRLAPRLSASGRLASPRDPAGAEAALGIEWQPHPRFPVRLLAERRQALGGEARSGFALLAHGGVSGAPLGPLRLDAYAQAGAVGLKRRDLFADGAARLSLPLGNRLSVGAGAWAAAQPGAARLDLGPTASWRLPQANARLTLDWRVRTAGDARPASGPALTLAADF